MLTKYYSLKPYREVLRKKNRVSLGLALSQRKHGSTLQRCQHGPVLNSRTTAVKSLFLILPFKTLLPNEVFFPRTRAQGNSPPYQRQLHPGLQRASTVLDGASAVPEETRAVLDGATLGSRRHFTQRKPVLVAG